MRIRLRRAVMSVATVTSIVAGPVEAEQPSFETWLEEVRQEAREKGIGAGTIQRALGDVERRERVLELDRSQPEFVSTFWDYMDHRVTPGIVQRGREELAAHRDMLRDIQRDHGVQPRFLVALWGMETHYGDHSGGFQVIDATATLAHDPRRSGFFRKQLFHALRMVEGGHAKPDFQGSWAGATGQLQFLPSTFVRHAVDRDGDGRKDIWGDLADVFASGANYLDKLGWRGDERWGREVRLPADFPWAEAQLDVKKPLATWAEMGVTKANGDPLPTPSGMKGAIVLPQGHEGPAFLVYENFRHILSWNRSLNYAIAVGHLADRIVGGPKIRTGRDAPNEPVSFDEIETIQKRLNALGHNAGPVDGVPGPRTRDAIRRFQQANDIPADGHPSPVLLDRLKSASRG